MTYPQIWLVVAIILFILEIFTPGFVLANIGVAAMAAAIAGWLGADLAWQFIAFAVAGLVSFVTVRPLLLRTIKDGGKGIPTGVDALVGREAFVTEIIPAGIGRGRVQVDADSWLAVSADEQEIPDGTPIVIERVDSSILVVRRSG